MIERNTALFFQVADEIEQHPDRYDQSAWCGTRGCIAGHAVHLSRPNLHVIVDCPPKGFFDQIAHLRVMESAMEHDFIDEARGLLGLLEDEARILFEADWEPHEGLSVPDALRKIAEGASIRDVTSED